MSCKILALYFPRLTFDIVPFLRDGEFPQLRSLKCCFKIRRECAPYVVGFMERHPSIEVLHWAVTSSSDATHLLANTLPALREISGDSDSVSAFLTQRSDDPRPLICIMNITVDQTFWTAIRPQLDASLVVKMDVEQFGCISDIYSLAREFKGLVYLKVDLSETIWDDTSGIWRSMKNVRKLLQLTTTGIMQFDPD